MRATVRLQPTRRQCAARELLFHRQEHRFTIPQISDALKTLGLEFLGWERASSNGDGRLPQTVSTPGDDSVAGRWHQFEQDHPDTFSRMDQF
jgi:hypothetical protein